jgi:hypothetical protein
LQHIKLALKLESCQDECMQGRYSLFCHYCSAINCSGYCVHSSMQQASFSTSLFCCNHNLQLSYYDCSKISMHRNQNAAIGNVCSGRYSLFCYNFGKINCSCYIMHLPMQCACYKAHCTTAIIIYNIILWLQHIKLALKLESWQDECIQGRYSLFCNIVSYSCKLYITLALVFSLLCWESKVFSNILLCRLHFKETILSGIHFLKLFFANIILNWNKLSCLTLVLKFYLFDN